MADPITIPARLDALSTEDLQRKVFKMLDMSWEQIEGVNDDIKELEKSVNWRKATPRDLMAARQLALDLSSRYMQLVDAAYAINALAEKRAAE